MTLFLLLLLAAPDTAGVPSVPGEPGESGIADVLFAEYRLLFRDLLGRTCAFSPSCSVYGQEAMGTYGPVLGTMMALERWTRCHGGVSDSHGYAGRGPDGRVPDPLRPAGETTCWGRSLLPF